MGVAERRQQEKEERIRRILQAALRVFAHEGLQPATVEAIAREAELGKGTIYYYFPSKEALLEELIAGLSEDYFHGLLEGARGEKTPLGIAQGVLGQLLEQYRREPERFRVLYMVLGEPEPRPHRALQTFVEAHFRWLRELRAAVEGVLEDHGVPVDSFLYLVGTYCHGVLFEAVAGRPPDRLQEEACRALAAFLTSPSTGTGEGPNDARSA